MPENNPISAATSFLAQVTSIGNWKPIHIGHAAVFYFIKMHEVPEVQSVEINIWYI